TDHRAVGAFAGDEPRALARRLQIRDAARQLGLARARLGAAGGCAIGGDVDATGRLAARPLARHLVDAAGDAAARVEQLRHGHGATDGRVEAGNRTDAPCREWLQHQRLVRLEALELRGL